MEPKAPKMYDDFIARFPELGEAWEAIHRGGAAGPLDERTSRLIKLAVAIGAKQTGAVSSSVRKGLAAGIPLEELEQTAALAASTIGLPATVAAWGWIRGAAEKAKR